MSKAKILVVDDDAISLELMEAMLVPNGYEIITAETNATPLALPKVPPPAPTICAAFSVKVAVLSTAPLLPLKGTLADVAGKITVESVFSNPAFLRYTVITNLVDSSGRVLTDRKLLVLMRSNPELGTYKALRLSFIGLLPSIEGWSNPGRSLVMD